MCGQVIRKVILQKQLAFDITNKIIVSTFNKPWQITI